MPATQLTDNGDGSYTVAYQTTVRGRLQVYVSLNGRDMPDSPFEVVSDTKVRRGLAQKMLADRRLTREKRDVSTVDEQMAMGDESAEEGEGEGEGEGDGAEEAGAESAGGGSASLDKSSLSRASAGGAEDPDPDEDDATAAPAAGKAAGGAPRKKAEPESLMDRMARLLFCRGSEAETPRAEDPKAQAEGSKLPRRGEKLF